ncbi:hypothetical protein ACFC8N_48270 [Streptomyces sp. NPDC055966]|uniref:hypothetical protein n=1 Tax=Streptomyces sp. NPDC055966 TaxID=3345669 RepID=UPI0035D5991E
MGAHRAAAAEWARIVQLLATVGGPYDADADAVVQDELAAGAEREREKQRQKEKRLQEEEAEAARHAALAPDVLRHALLGTLARTGLLDSLSEDERAAVGRPAHAATTTSNEHGNPATTLPCVRSATGSSAFSTAASSPALSTTRRPLGRITRTSSPLDLKCHGVSTQP